MCTYGDQLAQAAVPSMLTDRILLPSIATFSSYEPIPVFIPTTTLTTVSCTGCNT